MTQLLRLLLWMVCHGVLALTLISSVAQAANTIAIETNPYLRGFYVEGQMGLGHSVLGPSIGSDPLYPGLANEAERLGFSSSVHLTAGYDVLAFLALELTTGLTWSSTYRIDRVRDMEFLFTGVGVRASVPLTQRLFAIIRLSPGYARSNNAVEPPSWGWAGMSSLGVEYFVQVRHVSIGADLTLFGATSPLRLVVALAPHLKYTF